MDNLYLIMVVRTGGYCHKKFISKGASVEEAMKRLEQLNAVETANGEPIYKPEKYFLSGSPLELDPKTGVVEI